ncbi:MAG: hypothetical protein ACRC2T_12785 [Thermoguttaceae bacterium]
MSPDTDAQWFGAISTQSLLLKKGGELTMGRFLAVDWDEFEVRFILGNISKDKLSVIKAGSEKVTVPSEAPAENDAVPPTEPKPEQNKEQTKEQDKSFKSNSPFVTNVGNALDRLLKSNKVGAAQTIFGLSSSSAEVIYFTLPPAKNEEIPELLKNQAIREVPNFTDSQPIDFLLLSDDPKQQRKLVTVTLNREQLKSVRAIGRAAHRKPDKIEYRAIAAAEILEYYESLGVASSDYASGNSQDDTESGVQAVAGSVVGDTATGAAKYSPPTLLVNLLVNELDLVVVNAGKTQYVRSVKLPGVISETHDRILGEIKRTLAAGTQEDADEPIGRICVLASKDQDGNEEHAALIEKLGALDRELLVLDPFTLVQTPQNLIPDLPSSFASLVGMILCELPNKKPKIDLLHPKSKPKPPNYVPAMLLLVVLFLLASYGAYSWNKKALKKLDAKLTKLKKQNEELIISYNQLSIPYMVLNNADMLDKADTVWLDTLRDIIPLFPDQQDMIVNRIEFISGPIPRIAYGNYYSGQIVVSAMVREPSVIYKLKQQLEAKRLYSVYVPTPTPNPTSKGYPWSYTFAIRCLKVATPETYLQFQPEDIRAESLNQPENPPENLLPQIMPQQNVQPQVAPQ